MAIAAAFAVFLVVLIVTFLMLTTYNDVVGLVQRTDKAWSNIDVALDNATTSCPTWSRRSGRDGVRAGCPGGGDSAPQRL